MHPSHVHVTDSGSYASWFYHSLDQIRGRIRANWLRGGFVAPLQVMDSSVYF